MEDSRIIELFFARSEQAITELSLKYGKLLLHIAHNILGDREDAAECVNDTYLGVWNSIPPNRPDPFIAYICRIARNQALKKYRSRTADKRKSSLALSFEELEGTLSCISAEDMWTAKETGAEINRFLETLDKESRVMFVRRYYFSDSVGNIARIFSMTENHVSVKLSRMRKQLKKYLAEKGILVE